MVTTSTNRAQDDEPDFSDTEDYVDSISNEELLPELMSHEPRLDKSTDRIIVIDNIPVVGQDKKDKLRQILTKLLSKYGTIVNEHYPESENGHLKGYIFIEFSNEHEAQDVQAHLNGYILDKNHTFKANMFSDFDKYHNLNLADQQDKPISYKDHGNLMWWLTENDADDQYALLYNDFISVYQNTRGQPTLLESRNKWTETRFQWSPKGTYLATFHDKGIALWAGPQFKQFMRFSHQGVQLIDFSPSERYLVTCNPARAGVDDQALVIWCVRSGQSKRSFTCEKNLNISWPFFKWNKDDSYFARLATDNLLIYEAKTFSLLEKKMIKVPHIQDFEWSPTDNYIAYWVAQDSNVLARVVLMELPSKNEIRSKNLFNVSDCKMYWESNGDYVCVRVDRYKKQNIVKDDEKENVRYSGMFYNLEIFHIREKQIPVDSIEIKEPLHSFAWEPNGLPSYGVPKMKKFAIVSGEGAGKMNAVFYRIVLGTNLTAAKIEPIKEIKGRFVSQIYWSPQGQHCVLATTASKSAGASAVLEFYDVTEKDVQLINKIEQDHMTDIEWDPTGRFLVTYVSYWNFKSENAYMIWNFQGKLLQRMPLDRLFKFSWRPRPASLITVDQVKEIRKNFKTYNTKYSREDEQSTSKASKELLDKRRSLIRGFNEFKRDFAKRMSEIKAKRLQLRGGVDVDKMEGEEVEFEVQFLVDSKKEEIKDSN